MQDLKRCPFCGSSKVYVRFYNQPSVCCEECLCMGPAAQRLTRDNKVQCEKEAALRWNKRVDLSHKITLEAGTPVIKVSFLSHDSGSSRLLVKVVLLDENRNPIACIIPPWMKE